MQYDIRPLPYALGAEVYGLDLSKPVSPEIIKQLNYHWIEHKVLIFIDQHITDDQQIEFTRLFGKLEEFPMNDVRDKKNQVIFNVANVDEKGKALPVDHNTYRYLKVTQKWHIDSSYRALPSRGSILRGIELTRQGGETWFCDLEEVYNDLPIALKSQIEGKKAVHDFEVSRRLVGNLTPLPPEEKAAVPPVEHSMVRVHPDSGRASLFLSPVHISHIVGMSMDESNDLLNELTEFATQDCYVYKHRWWPGDVLMWDNRSIMHYAQPFDGRILRRQMHRTTLANEAAVDAA